MADFYNLYVKERQYHSTRLWNKNLQIEMVVSNNGLIGTLTRGFVKGLKVKKPYHLTKLENGQYQVKGTPYKLLKTNSSNTIILAK